MSPPRDALAGTEAGSVPADSGGDGKRPSKPPGTPPSLFPPFAEFNNQPLCRPAREEVVVVNANPRHNLRLLSLSSPNNDFHCSWFRDENVPPGKNTSFTVLYLGRHPGRVESRITLSTSQGDMHYEVFASGAPAAHGVLPFASGHIAVGHHYRQPIVMHNPGPAAMHVVEIYTSMPSLSLRIPGPNAHNGQPAAEAWQIPAYSSKTVAVVEASSKEPAFINGYVNVRTKEPSENLVVGVEVTVDDQEGLYFGPGDQLDFGLVYASDFVHEAPLQLMYHGTGKAKVVSLRVSNCQHSMGESVACPGLTLERGVSEIAGGEMRKVAVAGVYTASSEPGVYNGTIVAEYVTTSESTVRAARIPYRITVVGALLALPNLDLTFFVSGPPFKQIRRSLHLTNRADRDLLISNVSIPPQYSGLFAVGPVLRESGRCVGVALPFGKALVCDGGQRIAPLPHARL